MDGIPAGVLALAVALRDTQTRFELDSIAATKVVGGHALTLRWSGGVLEVERDDGELLLVDATGLVA